MNIKQDATCERMDYSSTLLQPELNARLMTRPIERFTL
ncbi:hypothetical protein TERTU_2155 [Teredinibacter turnerae T7901]|uniref:Uncharacterized protein n=1 Tax=Teredinibacter turnerae (strain ATCC 39867 / T7901) TaxID=377629 RepID=C5BJE6_TERTT|nr:hypothetical protein TERTU_2155 [Teredinibacter turnerae T7901]